MKWSYKGQVVSWNGVLSESWSGETTASSKNEAKSNLLYQYKTKYNIGLKSKIWFTGDVKPVIEKRR